MMLLTDKGLLMSEKQQGKEYLHESMYRATTSVPSDVSAGRPDIKQAKNEGNH